MARIDLSQSGGENIEGVRPCIVIAAEEKVSKKGAPMFEIELEVLGEDTTVRDYIMLSGKAARWHSKKIKAILGLKEDLADGEEVNDIDRAAGNRARPPDRARHRRAGAGGDSGDQLHQ